MSARRTRPLTHTGSLEKIAHDPGDPQITSHCPFCGSGQIVGRSDGTIECDFCGMNYIVRVQPAFPGMPQGPGMMGAPTDVGPEMGPGGEMMGPEELGPDGMPLDGEEDGGFPPDAEEDGEMPPGEEEEGEDDGDFPPQEEDDDEGGGDEGPPKKSKDKGKKKEGARYRTLTGAELPEESYVRHLAVLHSGGDPKVLAQLKAEAADR